MRFIYDDDPLAVAVVQSIQQGDIPSLTRLLEEHQDLAVTRIAARDSEPEHGLVTRTLLHIATDWPGHFPNVASTINSLIAAGADVNARYTGPSHSETPLHWAASNDDVQALDALLDQGADIDASGAVIAEGTPLDDAIAFAQWRAAHRLAERGAEMALWHAAALGYMNVIEAHFAGDKLPNRYPWGAGNKSVPDEVTIAFWCACHGGQQNAAEFLLAKGAELNWISIWDGLTPLNAAQRNGAAELVKWLRSIGAVAAKEG